jgi:hypothetical protein
VERLVKQSLLAPRPREQRLLLKDLVEHLNRDA